MRRRLAGRRLPTLLPLALAALAACTPAETPPLGPSANRAPEIRAVTLSPASVPPRGTARVQVDALDPDGDALFFRFTADTGTVTADPAHPGQATYVHAGGTEGSDRLTVTVTDTRSATATLTRTVPLQGNRGPQVQVIGLDQSCHPPCAVTFVADGTDPDGDELDYVWSGCASGRNPQASCFIDFPGTATAAVLVSDAQGGVTTLTVTAEGVNRAPVVRGVMDLPGGTPRLLVFETDADGDRMVCGWWGDCECTGSVQSFNLRCNPPGGASCFQRFACTDPFGATGEFTFTLRR